MFLQKNDTMLRVYRSLRARQSSERNEDLWVRAVHATIFSINRPLFDRMNPPKK